MWYRAHELWAAVSPLQVSDPTEKDEADAFKVFSTNEWRLVNVLKNPPMSPADRAKIISGQPVKLPNIEMSVEKSVADLAIKISDAFQLNELEAVDLVLTTETQVSSYPGIPLGLVAVCIYYDAHKLYARSLKTLIEWARQCGYGGDASTQWIQRTIIRRQVFVHLLELQEKFNVPAEFAHLSKHQGLGNLLHQNVLRSAIEETRQQLAEAFYLMAGYDDFEEIALPVLIPVLKNLKAAPAEKFGPLHVVAFTALLGMTGTGERPNKKTPDNGVALKSLCDEVRNETGWADITVCAALQLAVATSARMFQEVPSACSAIARSNLPTDMDVLVTRAISNSAFKFIHLCIVRNEIFRTNELQVEVIDRLLKRFIFYFPPKLMEVVRHSEDELTAIDECAARGVTRSGETHQHLEHFIRALSELYDYKEVFQGEEVHLYNPSAKVDELSAPWSVFTDNRLTQFMEMATRPQHVTLSMAFLELLRTVCRTKNTARTIYDFVSAIGQNDEGWIGLDTFMGALKSYEVLYSDTVKTGFRVEGIKPLPGQQLERAMTKYELGGMIGWLQLLTKIIQLDDEVGHFIVEDRELNAVEMCASLVIAPVPKVLKGHLLRFLGALGGRKARAPRVWQALATFGVCEYKEFTTVLGGITAELEMNECCDSEYSCSLGAMYLLRSLLRFPVPSNVAGFLEFLSHRIMGQLYQRSYQDAHQMFDLCEIGSEALYQLIYQIHPDAFTMAKREPQVTMLMQILNDSAILRTIFNIVAEDVGMSEDTAGQFRRSAKGALAGLRVILLSIQRLSPLRSAIRVADSNALLATLESLFFSYFSHDWKGCFLLHIMHYISKASEDPLHALVSARLLRDLCSTRPSLQHKIVDFLKNKKDLRVRLVNAIQRMFQVAETSIRYTVEDVNVIYSSVEGVNENDIGMVMGETARLIMEVMADGQEMEPMVPNLATFLLGCDLTQTDPNGALFKSDGDHTGFHALMDFMVLFIQSSDPFKESQSALYEPAMRLIHRLISPSAPRRQPVLRLLREKKIIFRLLTSPFMREQVRLGDDSLSMVDDGVSPTIASASTMISGYILTMAALELHELLKEGSFDEARPYYTILLESNAINKEINAIIGDDDEEENDEDEEESEASVIETPLLFCVLKNARIKTLGHAPKPQLECFDSIKIQKLLNTCKGAAVYEVEQYDVAHVHWLLKREIAALNMEDAARPTAEMQSILSFVVSHNAYLLSAGAMHVLISGCATILEVLAGHAPVEFYSMKPQLDSLLDAAFLLIELSSSKTPEINHTLCSTLNSVTKAVVKVARVVYSGSHFQRRTYVARLLLPLLELLVQPIERSLSIKYSIYSAISKCLHETAAAKVAMEKEEDNEVYDETDVQWLLRASAPSPRDMVKAAISSLASEVVRVVSRDIQDFPPEFVTLPVTVLKGLLEEDRESTLAVGHALVESGRTRAFVELTVNMPVESGLETHPPLIALNAMLSLLASMALNCNELWRALADLSTPSVLARIDILRNPPRELYLDPEAVNRPGTDSASYCKILRNVLYVCMALMSNCNFKVLSLQVVEALDAVSDVLSQLLRAEVQCDVILLARKLSHYIYTYDDVTHPYMENHKVLTTLREYTPPTEIPGGVRGPKPILKPNFVVPFRQCPSDIPGFQHTPIPYTGGRAVPIPMPTSPARTPSSPISMSD